MPRRVEAGIIAIGFGLLAVIFRKHFRHEGPAGMRPMFEKEPTNPVEQWIVLGIGVVFVLSGIAILLGFD